MVRSVVDDGRLQDLREETRKILLNAIGPATDVAILDAPNQRNVGDSLIWEGEIEYLSQIGKNICYVADINGFDARDLRTKLPHDGVVLLHGGGNFGDLWLGHQMHREKVVTELVDFKIVQLSQSIYFESAERAQEANQILSIHPDFTVLVRDTLSIERAKEQLPGISITFCPDMAFGYEPRKDAYLGAATQKVLVIARADKESASGLRQISQLWAGRATMQITDWGLHAKDRFAWKVARQVASVQRTLCRARRKIAFGVPTLPQATVRRAITTINRVNVESAISLYSDASVVVVDRLHAHVLATLLGIPNVLLDNNYRKLGGVYDDYSGRFGVAHYCINLDEAQATTKSILGS